MPKASRGPLRIGGVSVRRGTVRDIGLKISESYAGKPISIYIRVIRSRKPGPTVFMTGAVHGDELNGTGIIREIMLDRPTLRCGTLICIPVANIYGFENHSRYLPDRRDLNRSFPGSAEGSLAFRLADVLYREVICRSDYGLDLHTAAVRRTNFPQIRADVKDERVRRLAIAFGCEIIINDRGPDKTLRDAATESGCPTILYEAGEAFKFEPAIIKLGVRGVYNVLKSLKMTDGEPTKPTYQTVINRMVWLRPNVGGILVFHVRPGEAVKKGDKVATINRMFGQKAATLVSPVKGIVLGMTTLPAVKPGEAVCHLAIPEETISEIRSKMGAREKSLHGKAQKDLATSFRIVAIPNRKKSK
jgi:uncharacterized protein